MYLLRSAVCRKLTYNLAGIGISFGSLFALDTKEFDSLGDVLEHGGKEHALHGTDVDLAGDGGEDAGHLLLTWHNAWQIKCFFTVKRERQQGHFKIDMNKD